MYWSRPPHAKKGWYCRRRIPIAIFLPSPSAQVLILECSDRFRVATIFCNQSGADGQDGGTHTHFELPRMRPNQAVTRPQERGAVPNTADVLYKETPPRCKRMVRPPGVRVHPAGTCLQVTDARGKWHQMLSCNVRFDWCITRLDWLLIKVRDCVSWTVCIGPDAERTMEASRQNEPTAMLHPPSGVGCGPLLGKVSSELHRVL
jgi:hypothetical protein